MATQTTQSSKLNRPNFLRNVLIANIAFSTTFGVVFTFLSGAIATFAGVAWESYFQLLGIGLFGFAGFVFYTMRTLNPRLIWIVFALDIIWVISSYALLLLGLLPITDAAKWAFAFIADAVLVFGILEYIGLRR